MLSPSEYGDLDAVAIGELVRRGELTAAEVVDAALRAVDALNPELNAVVTRMDEHARSTAASVGTGDLAGAPIVLKDEYQFIPGVPTQHAARISAGLSQDHPTELVLRYGRAGVVVAGKANLPEFGASVTCEPVATGVTRNPWRLDRTVGGSSGGSATAVAAGLVPLGYANDGAGSIRIPASCTGVFGLKPTRGRVPTGPDNGELWNGLVIEHAVTRTVRDSAALLDATDGPDTGAPYHPPAKRGPFLAEVGRPPGRLRIGMSTASPHGSEVHPDCVAAVRDAAALLEDLGHTVEEATPPHDAHAVVDAVGTLLSVHLAYGIDALAAATGIAAGPDTVETCNWELAQRARKLGATDLLATLETFTTAARTAAPYWATYDAWLTPTLGQPPVEHGEITPMLADPDDYLARWFTFAPFTPLANVTGNPAMTLPTYWNADGLPIGVNVTAGFGEEATLFRLAGQVEQARPWSARRPPTSVWAL